jgi:hypothetical protein
LAKFLIRPGAVLRYNPPQYRLGEKLMKHFNRLSLMLLVCLLMVSTALGRNPPKTPPVSVTGIYGGFEVGKGSGDLEGMRVSILSAGNGYYAIVQIAQGGAEDPTPVFVEVTVKGASVSFAVGERKFTGTATAAGLRIKEDGNQAELLKRKPCSTLF